MALNKTIVSRSGFEMSYWKITDWHIIISQNLLNIDITPYISQETRQNNLEPVHDERKKIRVIDKIDFINPTNSTYDYTSYFSPSALEQSNLDIYKIMYNYIKEKVPEFQGAIDV